MGFSLGGVQADVCREKKHHGAPGSADRDLLLGIDQAPRSEPFDSQSLSER
jgi:hypothetical protein